MRKEPGKTLKTIALFAAALGLASAVCPGLALAEDDEDALYEPEVVIVNDDTSVVDPQTNVTYQKTSGNYRVILTGVSDANKDVLADAVLANVEKGEPIKFVNSGFIDAEKYSTSYEGFDKYHCWLCSTSNVLTLTGWASRYTNPLTGAQFTNEDDVFAFLSSSFTDATCLPDRAYSYFFDGLFGGSVHYYLRTENATDLKPVKGISHTGFDQQICSASFVKRVECDSTLSAFKELEGLGTYALEMSIEGGTSHSVTAVGAVIDESKTGAERYVGVLIADSDNEAPTSDGAPTSFEEANTAKSSKTNSYTLYHLGTTSNDGQTVMALEKYMKSKSTYVGSFTQVDYYSDAVRTAAKETADNATSDAKTTGDITLSSLSTFNGDYKTKDCYTTADKLTLQAIILSLNADVAFNTKTTGQDYLENKIEVYRDGELVGTIEDGAKLSLENDISCSNGTFMNLDLSPYAFLKVPGEYTLKFYLNTGNIDEAYVTNNNSPRSVSFTLKAAESDDDDDDDNEADDTDDDTTTTTAKTTTSSGDGNGLIIASGAAAAAAAALACAASARARTRARKRANRTDAQDDGK